MYDFFRAVSAVPDVSVAEPGKNVENILDMLRCVSEKKPDLVSFPELCITGYTCADLFFQSALISGASEGLRLLCERSSGFDFPFVVGLPIEIDGKIFNCAAVIAKGKVYGIAAKTFIPNYNEFYEKRWFASAAELDRGELSSLELGFDDEYKIPIGNDLIFETDGAKFAVEVCEDLWSPVSPSAYLSLGGAELIVNVSASNETIAKRRYRRDLVRGASARFLGAYLYTSAGESESTTDLVFSGHSVIAENGTVVAENSETIDGNYFIIADVDLGKIRADRRKITTFRDAAALYGKTQSVRNICCCGGFVLNGDGRYAKINRAPFVPSNAKDRKERCLSIFEMQVAGLKKRLKITGTKPVIGVSGGLDSTLALLVSVRAVMELNRPLSDVCGITLPCFGTSDRTYSNAVALMEKLNITREEINIKDACNLHFKDIGQNPQNYDLTYENSQARERTQVLMDYAGKVGGLVVGTGDLSELALGWCTYNADHMSMYGVNSSIPKTLVRWLIDTLAQTDIFPGCCGILKDISDTPISPELIPPDKNGNISQKTENLVGPYELHDFFMYNILRFGFEPGKVYALARLAFDGSYDDAQILKWLKNFYKRFFTQQFKRSCLPDGVKVGSICLSPRGDWRMPSDASAKLWLDAVDRL